jgi:hypothetical protein
MGVYLYIPLQRYSIQTSVSPSSVMMRLSMVLIYTQSRMYESRKTSDERMTANAYNSTDMSNSNLTINERAFAWAMQFALAAVWNKLVELIVLNTPRDVDRPPIHTLDRKDGQRPKRKGGVTNLNGHWYPQVTWKLKDSIMYELDMSKNAVKVWVSMQWPAKNYAEYLEWSPDTPTKKGIRPFLSYTIENPLIHQELVKTFEQAFYTYLNQFND